MNRTYNSLRSETGLTLIEVLISVMILGIAFVAILGAMSTTIIGSALHRKQAHEQTLIRSYAEAVKEIPYESCTPSADPTNPSLHAQDPVEYQLDQGEFDFEGFTPVPNGSPPNVKYWHPDEFDQKTGTFEEHCPDLNRDGRFEEDSGIQSVFLSVTSADGVVESVEIGKRVKLGSDTP